MAKDFFEITDGTLDAVRAEFTKVSSARTQQLVTVAVSLGLALLTGYLVAVWNTKNGRVVSEWFSFIRGPDLRGFVAMFTIFFVPGALALFSLVSWFRVLDGRITGTMRDVVEALAPKLDGPLSVRVFWGTPTTTSSNSSRVQFKSEDFVLRGTLAGQPFSLVIEDHDSMRRRSSTAQRTHVTFWQVTVTCGERTIEERIDGEALPVERLMAIVGRVIGGPTN